MRFKAKTIKNVLPLLHRLEKYRSHSWLILSFNLAGVTYWCVEIWRKRHDDIDFFHDNNNASVL